MELKKQLFKLGLVFYLERRLRHHVVGAVIDEGLITWNHLKKQVRVPTLPCGKRRRRLPHQNRLAQEENVAMKVEAPPKPARTSVCVLVASLFVTAWTAARQAPLSMGFSKQEYWSGLHVLLQGIFPIQ